nr:MAG TPA: hypothetical protein [Caudoviricetes sp.]
MASLFVFFFVRLTYADELTGRESNPSEVFRNLPVSLTKNEVLKMGKELVGFSLHY